MHFALSSAYVLVTGHLGALGVVTPLIAIRWGLLTSLVSLSLVACPPLLEQLRRSGMDWTRPQVRSWVLYYGVYAAVAVGTAILRSVAAPWALGTELSPLMFWRMVGLLSSAQLSLVIAIEIFIARHRERAYWLEASDRLERELVRSQAELVTADDRLRLEAAEYLHGEVQSRLLMVWALLDQSSSADDEEQDLLQKAQGYLEQLQGMGLRHAREIMGLARADRTLSEQVRELVLRFQAAMSVELELDPAVSHDEQALRPELRLAAGRMLEEALLNAFRHARAKRIRVRYARHSDMALVLSVEDDGIGFEPSRSPRGLGLSGLGTGLAEHGGTWEIQSRPGCGTRVDILVPTASLVRG